MTLSDLASWSTIIQTVFVVISLFFIWRQLRQNAELAKAANVQALVEHASSFNSMLIQNKEIAQLWYGRGKKLKKNSDKQIYRELIVQWLIFHENIYYQYHAGLLDSQIYNSWREDLKFVVQTQSLELISKDLQGFFPGEFGKHLIKLQKDDLNGAFQPGFEVDEDK